MKKILLIHGPNLNMLGLRDTDLYGKKTLASLESEVKKCGKGLGLSVITFQSNHEGELIDFLQKNARSSQGILINPGALAHYSYALHDALLDTKLPAIEVHISDIKSREKWRRVSVTALACKKLISGKNINGYLEGLKYLSKLYEKK